MFLTQNGRYFVIPRVPKLLQAVVLSFLQPGLLLTKCLLLTKDVYDL